MKQLNEVARMQQIAGILTEIKVNNPDTQIKFGLDKDGNFTELVKLKNYSNPEKAIQDINKKLNLGEDDGYYLDDYQPQQLNYCQLSGDGCAYFSEDLSNFSDGYNTEEGWGVLTWEDKPNFK